jgi:hypothetical protein
LYGNLVRSLVAIATVSVSTMGIMGTICYVTRVGLEVRHVAGSPGVPRFTSICWDTGILVTGSPTVAF